MTEHPFTPTEPYAAPTVVDVPEWQTMVARTDDGSMSRIREIMDTGFTAIGAALAQTGVQPAGAAFSKYDSDPSNEPFALEIGFPLAQALDEPVHVGDQVVIPSSLPSGRVATTSHVGAYDGLGQAWGDFMTWIAEQGLQPVGGFWEVYVTEPTPDADPASMRTDLVVPIA